MKNEYKTTWLKPHIKRGLTPIAVILAICFIVSLLIAWVQS